MTTAAMSYEQARAELASIVERLESGGSTLEESLALWERGEQLAAVCQGWLDGARTRLDAARAEPTAERPAEPTAERPAERPTDRRTDERSVTQPGRP